MKDFYRFGKVVVSNAPVGDGLLGDRGIGHVGDFGDPHESFLHAHRLFVL